MMACRRLAREASLRRGAVSAPRLLLRYIMLRPRSGRQPCSSLPRALFEPRFPTSRCRVRVFALRESGPWTPAAAVRPQPAQRIWDQHRTRDVTSSGKEKPSKAITTLPPGSLKNELGSFWPLVRKLQLPIGLMFLIVSGWQYPLGLVINVLLLIYCSRPSRYSIYLFLQELRHWEMGQSRAMWKEEFVRTRNVDVQDYKFFSIGTVELPDGRVLHLIGILGSWWIYHVSYVK
ncbi:uncharacterized protein C2845_PM07G00250 [Panicum miliaceum]|uniref:Uncharacterized protein n=1 Tax=Panicum miliaceum TaxID=4540 RepID=A0A3L6ST88_PANMI|nr:uncharacterized protein C2845_PM07G00250 [Panicum miliaceum]